MVRNKFHFQLRSRGKQQETFAEKAAMLGGPQDLQFIAAAPAAATALVKWEPASSSNPSPCPCPSPQAHKEAMGKSP